MRSIERTEEETYVKHRRINEKKHNQRVSIDPGESSKKEEKIFESASLFMRHRTT